MLTNPCDHATLPRQPHNEAAFLSPKQVNAFLDAAKDDPWYDYWLTLARTGMRPGEALGLQWRDLGKGTLSIHRTVVRIGKSWSFEDCKTKRSKRTITIPKDLQIALEARRGTAGSIGADTRLIFHGRDGAPPDMRTLVRLHFDPYREAANLGKCSPYALRHSHISDLLAQGVPVTEVSARAGHSSPVMTLGVYAHVLASSGDRMAAALERAAGDR